MLMNTTFLEDSFSIKWQTRDDAKYFCDKKLSGYLYFDISE